MLKISQMHKCSRRAYVIEPNTTLRYEGKAYSKLEWIEKPQN